MRNRPILAAVPGVLVLLLAAVLVPGAAMAQQDAARPIVADLAADPAAYDGHRIFIYGLVVEVDAGTRSVMLQDVSQRPIRVIAPGPLLVRLHDQIEVEGRFEAGGEEMRVLASRIGLTRVLGGGGCC